MQRIIPGENIKSTDSTSWHNTKLEVPECIKSFIANQWVVHVQFNSEAKKNVIDGMLRETKEWVG